MDNDSVVHIVDIVALTAVKNLNYLIRSCHLGFLPLHGVHSIRKGLAAAVVGNGDGAVTPGGRLFDSCFRIGQGVHIGHNGMQVQLHALLSLRRILTIFHSAGHNGVGS